MNERIRELAKEARLLTGWTVGEVEYQKFAELIVRECVGIADHSNVTGKSIIGERIKEHFGVKE